MPDFIPHARVLNILYFTGFRVKPGMTDIINLIYVNFDFSGITRYREEYYKQLSAYAHRRAS